MESLVPWELDNAHAKIGGMKMKTNMKNAGFEKAVGGGRADRHGLEMAIVRQFRDWIRHPGTLDRVFGPQLSYLEQRNKILLLSEDNDIRRERLKLEQQRLQSETQADLSDEIPKLAQFLMDIEEDDDLSEEEKAKRIHAFLFPGAGKPGLAPISQSEANDAT
jgi:hypothetical protein